MNEEKEAKPLTTSPIKKIAYWVTTAIIVLETAAGAQWDLVGNPLVVEVVTHLGYPLYILTIMGIWKIFGAIVLIIPGFPRLKEWAYAGVFFIYSGAAISALANGSVQYIVGPLAFALITVVSWYLRPPSRRIDTNQNSQTEDQDKNPTNKKWKAIGYWTTIVILGFVLLSGGFGEMLHLWGTLETTSILHYPLYFLSLIGVWKILGGIAIIVPRFQLLKEWAYAGIFFNMTGAAASHAMSNDYGNGSFHIIVPLAFAGIAIASWALRPAGRKLL